MHSFVRRRAHFHQDGNRHSGPCQHIFVCLCTHTNIIIAHSHYRHGIRCIVPSSCLHCTLSSSLTSSRIVCQWPRNELQFSVFVSPVSFNPSPSLPSEMDASIDKDKELEPVGAEACFLRTRLLLSRCSRDRSGIGIGDSASSQNQPKPQQLSAILSIATTNRYPRNRHT